MLYGKKKQLNDLNQTVCLCLNISVGDIQKAIDEGDTTLEDLIETTNAGIVCMRCQSKGKDLRGYRKIYIEDVLKNHHP